MRRVALRIGAVALVAAVGACLESLPPAQDCDLPARIIDGACVECDPPLVFLGDECTECPPPAQIPHRPCLPALAGVPETGDGCLSDIPNAYACLAGDPPDCACDPGDCEEPLACFGDASCPREVLESAPDATCLPLDESHWSFYVYPSTDADHDTEGCICGCVRCAARCDGRGAIFGIYEDGQPPYRRYLQGPAIDLRGLLPDRGKLGFYVRGRGWAGSVVAFVTHDLTLTETDTSYYVPFVNDFSVPVVYGPNDEGVPTEGEPAPYTWDAPADAPTHVLFTLTTGAGVPTSGILEIDCVIPFVEPLE
jgi:hypothetical protein